MTEQAQAQPKVTSNNFEFPTFTARAYIGEIRRVGDGDEAKFFVNIAVPYGTKENRKYQYYSVYVTKALRPLFDATYRAQVKESDRWVHSLSAQAASVVIESPYFEINESGFLHGSGILKTVAFDYSSNN